MTEHRIGRRPRIVCDDGAQDLLASALARCARSGTARTECVLDVVTQMSAGTG
jgi:hypothetical protein